ncbi:ABC transporter substrate-binding protein [Sinorhizobium meliloti]|nr:ABC transporter substrate-binding protein [Sinorhizobium meliloti]
MLSVSATRFFCEPICLLLAAFLLAFSITPAFAEILIGVAGPLTGPNAQFGAQIQKGAEFAAADINSAGGINGEQIKLVLGDDLSDVKQGVSVANKFVADGVKLVVGHFNSGVSLYVSEVYAENGILMISPGSSSPMLTARGLWNTFRTSSNALKEAELAAKYISDNYSKTEVWVVHDDSESSKAITAVVRDALSLSGQSINYSGLQNLSGSGQNEKVVFYDGVEELPDVSTTLANANVDGQLISLASPGLPSFLTPEGRDVVNRLEAAGFTPGRYALQAYAAIQILKQAAAVAGATDGDQVAAALKRGTFSTVIGEIHFDANGDIDKTEIAIAHTPIKDDWNVASAGVSRVCGTTCPASCNNSCTSGEQCCNVASFQVR